MSEPFPSDLIRPRWGDATLSDVLPAVLTGLGVRAPMGERGEAGAVATAIQPARGYVVLLVDGLGSVGLQEHAASAQYLSSLAAVELTAGCPSTTVTSLTSLATGLPPGEHGLPGYTTWEPRLGEAVHWLRWHPVGAGEDLREVLPPEVVQPHPTAWEIAEAAGIATTVVNAPGFESTGLTRAAFRGGRYAGILADGDTIDVVATAADRGHRSLVYTYLPQLDLMGHVRGPGSAAWIAQLSLVDRFAALLAESLPSGVTLLITGDHGMVELDPGQVIDADGGTPVWADGSALRDGVVVIAGEPRMHHVHTASGALADVEQTWRSLLGDRAWVVSGDEAVDLGLFGPVVSPPSRGRIGDLVVFSRDRSAVVQSRRESRSSAMPGHHGSLTAPELLVPLLLDAR